MKKLWCWRCKAEMPMLDEEEWSSLRVNLGFGTAPNLPKRLRDIAAKYERITGLRETNPNALFHHRLSMYGPPCARCGKPLRSPQAKLCGACMHPVAKS